MTAKHYLMKVHTLRKQCESLERKFMLVRSKAEGIKGISYDKDRVQTSPTNTLEEAAVELVSIEERYKDLIHEYNTAIVIRVQQIQAMENPTYAEVLTLRYIEDRPKEKDGSWQLTLDEIADRMGYSYVHVARLHGEALQAFEKQYSKYLEDDKK